MGTSAVKRYSVDEYLELEQSSEVKHEYFDGEIFAMAGAKWGHNQVAGNCVRELGNRLKDRNCSAVPSDMMVFCPTGLRTYPDVSIVCEEPRFEDDRELVLLNPLVLVEVVSDSTEAYDRGRKFENYKSIPSLQEYVLIAQDRMHVDHLALQSDNKWLITSYGEKDGPVELPALSCSLSLAEIYANVKFEKPVEESDSGEGNNGAGQRA